MAHDSVGFHGVAEMREVVGERGLPYFRDFCQGVDGPHGQGLAPRYRPALRHVVDECGLPNVHFVDGSELPRDFDRYAIGLCHPGDVGVIQIGENLANYVRLLTEEEQK